MTSSSGRCRNSLWVVNAWPSFLAMDCFANQKRNVGEREEFIFRETQVGVV